MDQLGITFVVLVPAIAMMFVKRTEKIGWWLAGLCFVWLTFWSLGFTAEHYWRYKGHEGRPPEHELSCRWFPNAYSLNINCKLWKE